ncbi:hypothetical protein MUS1_00005 [Marinomonas ushuaiensis DSM 15871]|uniref:Uncharacterized protein n=1 Tax=Marinomonas ushuaiensis DSM 15871 TaxID=1122207 RepID=X7E983_9GAMM|nr:hypothetical protein MUS1_00005 [Marinomonas ushuaiensis DSM 15871]
MIKKHFLANKASKQPKIGQITINNGSDGHKKAHFPIGKWALKITV